MSIKSQFSAEELTAIQDAAREAERETGAELVCVIVQQADFYGISSWKAATLGALAGTVLAGLWFTFGNFWITSTLPWILIPAVLGAALGTLAVWAIPSLRRALIPSQVMDLRLDRRAAVAFLDEEIFNTRDRTGVLLFISLFEHGIRILRDEEIERLIPAQAWEPIVDDLVRGLRSGGKGTAIVRALEACGRLLVAHGIDRRIDDENELGDEPRLHDA